jgi:NADH-quinone oxidoreductase subunit C
MSAQTLSEAVTALSAQFEIIKNPAFRDETSLTVQRSQIHEIARVCKEKLGFNYLLDISGVDHFGEEPRFEVVYELYRFEGGDYLRLKLRVSEDDLSVPTVSDVWATADWHERETYDMYGIKFSGHPDLRRILMWEGYPYFPLRKDFPLGGRSTEMPDVAFTRPAPLEGGPFVTLPSTATTKDREPRARPQE